MKIAWIFFTDVVISQKNNHPKITNMNRTKHVFILFAVT